MKITGFDDAFELLIGHEGGLSLDPDDPGNWTGGAIGKGELKGTKYGISAKTYPKLDIASLTLDQAKAIAKRDYWDRYHCDQIDPEIAFQVFDTAYHGGSAAKWLQQAAGVPMDGNIGAKTVAAVRALSPMVVIMRFNAYRLRHLARQPILPKYAGGWMNRIAYNLIEGAD